MVTGVCQVGDGVSYSCCTRGNGQAAYTAFQCGNAILKNSLSSVGQTAIDVSCILQVETITGVLRVVEHIRGGLVDRYGTRVGCGVGLLLAYVELQCLEMKLFLVAHSHLLFMRRFYIYCFFTMQRYDEFSIIGIAYSRHITYHKRGTTPLRHHDHNLVTVLPHRGNAITNAW